MFFEKIKDLICKGINWLKKEAKKLLNILKGEKSPEEPKTSTIDHGVYGNASYVNEYQKQVTIDHGTYGFAKTVNKKEYVKNAALEDNKVELKRVNQKVINHGMYEYSSLK